MIMKKLINDPADITSELLEGYCLSYANKVKLVAEQPPYHLMTAPPNTSPKKQIPSSFSFLQQTLLHE